LLSVPCSLSMSLLSTRSVGVYGAEHMCLTLMVLSIVHRSVGGTRVVGRLHSMSVLSGVASRDVVCGSAVVGSSGVVIS